MSVVAFLGWAALSDISDVAGCLTVDTVPINDVFQHQPGAACMCRPMQDEDAPRHFIHNSFDRREDYYGCAATREFN